MGALLRGNTTRDVHAAYAPAIRAVVATNASARNQGRAIGSSRIPSSFEVTTDHGKLNRPHFAGRLSNARRASRRRPNRALSSPASSRSGIAAAVLVHARRLAGGRSRRAPRLRAALRQRRPRLRRRAVTTKRFSDARSSSRRIPPSTAACFGPRRTCCARSSIAPTGWCFVNDPTRTNNSVGRDTAAFALGSDYVTPDFSRESLRWYLRTRGAKRKDCRVLRRPYGRAKRLRTQRQRRYAAGHLGARPSLPRHERSRVLTRSRTRPPNARRNIC